MRQWVKQTRRDLHDREERVRARENATCLRERDLIRDERFAALKLSEAEEKLAEAKRHARFPETPLVRYKTVIPMRIEHFDIGDGMVGSLHTPVVLETASTAPMGGEETGDASPSGAARAVPQRRRPGIDGRRDRSFVDEQLATMFYDESAQQQVVLQWGHVPSDLIRRPFPQSESQPESGPAEGFGDDRPPF